MQIKIHVFSVRKAEIKGTVHRENPVNWMCIWPHALETARENTLTDAALCCVVVNFFVVSVCVHIP